MASSTDHHETAKLDGSTTGSSEGHGDGRAGSHPSMRPRKKKVRSGAHLVYRSRVLLGLLLGIANGLGAVIVFVFAAWLIPSSSDVAYSSSLVTRNALGAIAYVLLVTPIGVLWGRLSHKSAENWLFEDRPPTAREVRRTLGAPRRLTIIQTTLWGIAAVAFTIVNGMIEPMLIGRVGMTVVCGGITMAAITFLLAERVNRPVVARALEYDPDVKRRPPGVTSRTMVMWAMGTAVPLLGIAAAGMSSLITDGGTRTGLAVAMVALGGLGLVIGFSVTLVSVRSVAGPIRAVRNAMTKIAEGDFDVVVDVNSSTEVGLLQSGFNRMAQGLREREQLRDLFGRQVGDDVARTVLATGIDLRGETRDASVLFVDVVASTGLAASLPPQEVLALLNRFFAQVIDVVDEHGGWINKFIGDAAMAVFGTPERLDDHAGAALGAARALAMRLDADLPEIDFGIGVSSGPVVAGHLGDVRRYEYTVIGDSVNVASRLTDQAKNTPGRVLCDWRAVEAAVADEATKWRRVEPCTVRGRLATVDPGVPLTGVDRPIPRPLERRIH